MNTKAAPPEPAADQGVTFQAEAEAQRYLAARAATVERCRAELRDLRASLGTPA